MLRIAQVAPLHERVPPALYGGTERVVATLTDELVRRGHQVTLFASGDSQTIGDLKSPVDRSLRLDPEAGDPIAAHMLELAQVFERADEFDLIHCHVDYLAFPFGRLVRTPTVHTLHGRLDLPHFVPLFRHLRDVAVVSISDAQRAPLRSLDVNWVGTVYHGVALESFPYSEAGGEYLAFLGRISPEKRPDLAIAVAKRLAIPLKIAAKVDAKDRAYFEREIRPLLDDPLIEFIGEIDEATKPKFLGGAMALLFPIDWPEPFGLVVIEAMACGTPVVAFRRASVPEIVEDGVTGRIVDNVDEAIAAIPQVLALDRRRVRQRFEERFAVSRMARDYVRVYRALLAKRSKVDPEAFGLEPDLARADRSLVD